MDPYSAAAAGAGALINTFTGQGLYNKQKQLMGQQLQYAKQQNQTYQQTQPYYMQALKEYANYAGLPGSNPQGGQQGQPVYSGGAYGTQGHGGYTTNTDARAMGSPGLQMGPYAQQAYNLRAQAGEEDIDRMARQNAQNLQFRLGQQGVASGTTAAALAHSNQDALAQYAQFRRNLAVNAGPEEMQRLQMLTGNLGPGMNAGAQGANIMGQQAGVYGNQAQQQFAGVGQDIAGMMQYAQMKKYMDAMNQMGGYGGYGGGQVNNSGGLGITPAQLAQYQTQTPWELGY